MKGIEAMAERKVKWLEVIPNGDLPKHRSINNVVDAINSHKYGRGMVRLMMSVMSSDSTHVDELHINGIVKDEKEFNDSFNDYTLLPVAIHLEDGSVEYGFKYWSEVPVKMKPRLTSIFLMDDPKLCDTPPWWMERLLPMWNDKIEQAILDAFDANENLAAKKMMGVALMDWNMVRGFIKESRYATTNAICVKDGGGHPKAMEVIMGLDVDSSEKPSCWEAIVKKMPILEKIHPKNVIVSECTYLKSIYRQVCKSKQRRRYRLIPVESILTISDMEMKADANNSHIIWDNLDATLKGNV